MKDSRELLISTDFGLLSARATYRFVLHVIQNFNVHCTYLTEELGVLGY